MGCLAEGMFCIRADVEGVQFSREEEREITGTVRMQFSEYRYSYHTEKDISIIYCTSFYSNTC